MTTRRTIGVLAGGNSPERDVSIVSGLHVHRALAKNGHTAALVQIDALDDLVPRLTGIDIVFNCLHGGAGEDGTVQLLLDVMGIPYAGSGARACFRAMEKPRTRAILTTHGIPIPHGACYEGGDLDAFLDDTAESVGLPLVLKPGDSGSTLAVHYVDREETLSRLAATILDEFPSLVVEQYIEGREITVGILRQDGADAPLPAIEIRIPGKLFDYEAKYTDGVAEFIAPAPLDETLAARVQAVALRTHQALGCFGYSRIDFRVAPDGEVFVLEANTLPGMTPLSDLPRAAACAGIPYEDLVDIMLATAENKEERE